MHHNSVPTYLVFVSRKFGEPESASVKKILEKFDPLAVLHAKKKEEELHLVTSGIFDKHSHLMHPELLTHIASAVNVKRVFKEGQKIFESAEVQATD